jgi:alkylhydroperoxidase family enzyme
MVRALTLGCRVPYLERDQVDSDVQALYDELLASEGRIDNEYKVMAYHPSSLRPFLAWQQSMFSGALDLRLRQLATAQASQLNGSRYCTIHNIEIGVRLGVPRQKFVALPAYPTSGLFNELERHVIRYATELTRRLQVDPELVADLEQRLGPAALVQLTLAIAYANFVNRFNVALNTEPETEPAIRDSGVHAVPHA